MVSLRSVVEADGHFRFDLGRFHGAGEVLEAQARLVLPVQILLRFDDSPLRDGCQLFFADVRSDLENNNRNTVVLPKLHHGTGPKK